MEVAMADETYTFTQQELRDMIQRCPLKALQEWAAKIQLTIPSTVEDARMAMTNHLNDAFGQQGGDIVIPAAYPCPCNFECLRTGVCCV